MVGGSGERVEVAARSRAWRQVIAVVGAALTVDALFVAPIVVRFQAIPLTWIAVEAVVFPLVFAVLPRRRWTGWLAVIAGGWVTVVTVIAFAEAATWRFLVRPLNLYLDWRLLGPSHDILLENTAWYLGVMVEVGLVAAMGLVWLSTSLLFAAAREAAAAPRWRAGSTLVASLAAVAMVSPMVLAYWPSGFAPSARLVSEQVERVLVTRAETRRFGEQLQAASTSPEPLTRLSGVDVVLAFVESYGVSAHRQRYAEQLQPALDTLKESVAEGGVSMVTGRMTSPVQGGQSWLAHGTAISGLWLDNQIRYDLVMRHDVPTLIDDLRASGHRSVGIFPAITEAWPDGERLGYDAVYSARNMGYRGPRLNWVTMPDQFTWHWLQQNVRASAGDAVFAELALISSHAPHTPILPVLKDWERIGNGSVFERWADKGPAPADLWRDEGRVRQYFARSLAYAIEVAAGYTRRHVDEDTLLILLGDHQPVPFIAGEQASRAVPVHVISGDEDLLRPFRERGFSEGAGLPRQQSVRLSRLRDWLIDAFGEGARPRQAERTQ